MIIVHHRQNTVFQLNSTPSYLGVEIDIRSYGDDLILQHDPFLAGEKFHDWLTFYKHQLLILNVKEEGLELKIIEMLKMYSIENYFFLDQSFPYLIKLVGLKNSRTAIRLSEYESINTCLNLKNKVKWVWVDYFSYFPLDDSEFDLLKKSGFNICIVSPELQGFSAIEVTNLRTLMNIRKMIPDAVCTKFPKLWE